MCGDNNMMRTVLLVFFLTGLNIVTATNIYRVVDEHGRVSYSQIPPYEGAEKIKLRRNYALPGETGRDTESSRYEKQKRYSDYLQSERLERKNMRQQQQQEKDRVKSNCYIARAELSDLAQGGVTYYELDENGKRVYIEKNVVDAKKKRLQKYIDQNCQAIFTN